MRLIIDIRLSEIKDPVVWRKVAIPLEITFHELHKIIQSAMGWGNQHLYSFREKPRSRFLTVVSPHTEEFGISGEGVSAAQVLWSYFNQFSVEDGAREKLYYEYDFGDSWLHEIDVMELDRSDQTTAQILEGGGACPPENCGGLPGFLRMKDYLTGKITEEEYYSWMSVDGAENFDVDHFDLEETQMRMRGWKMLR